MKFEDITRFIGALVAWVRVFKEDPLKAMKALFILGIFIVTIITQWSGYISKAAYGWMIVGLILIVVILLSTLRLAVWIDLKKS